MNNLVFNNEGSQLHAQVTNTLLTIGGEVEITNASIAVTGDVGITGTPAVTIANTLLTVGGEVEITNASIAVTGDVGITGTPAVTIANTLLTIAGEVEITNALVDVSITGHSFTETNTALTGVTGTGVAFDDTDISEITTGSFFVYNAGATAFTVSLQVSPTTGDGFYINDPDNDDVAVGANGSALLPISKFGHYARVLYDAASAVTFAAYYNGQM